MPESCSALPKPRKKTERPRRNLKAAVEFILKQRALLLLSRMPRSFSGGPNQTITPAPI